MSAPLDDRGNSFELAAPTGRQVFWRSLGVQKLMGEVTAQEQSKTVGLETGVALAGGGVGLLIWNYVIGPYVALPGIWDSLAQPVFAVIVAMTFWYFGLGYVRRRRASDLTEVALNAGRCASCAYELADLPTEDDGCVVCPECHAAWKAERISPEEPPPDAEP